MKRFTWAQIAVLVLLGAITVFATWDYVEVLRLDRELARIRGRGEPASLDDVPSPSRDLESPASRYYRAAAALVSEPVRSGIPPQDLLSTRLESARRSNTWPDDLLVEMRRQVEVNSEALAYLDRAAALEFTGFPESSAYSTREMEMFQLLSITRLRTMLLAVDGRAEAAASLHSGLKILRAIAFWGNGSLRRAGWLGLGMMTPALELVVTRTQPPADSLAAIADELADIDDDDLMRHALLWRRASSQINLNNPFWFRRRRSDVGAFRFGESLATAIEMPLKRPLQLHRMNRVLRDYGRAIDAQAGKSWPEKLDALVALDGEISDVVLSNAQGVASELAWIRVLRTVVAIERYRRTGGTTVVDWSVLTPFQVPLIDPYSGRPLTIASSADGYAVYSIGHNRRDDGGDPTHDISLRVTTNHQPLTTNR